PPVIRAARPRPAAGRRQGSRRRGLRSNPVRAVAPAHQSSSLPPRRSVFLPKRLAVRRVLGYVVRRCVAVRSAVRPPLAQRRDVDLSLAGPVELAEEDPLPLPEGELAVGKRHEHVWADQGRPDVRWRIRPVGILDVLPVPAVVDHLFQRGLEVLGDRGIGPFVDRDRRRGMRHVDECGRRAVGRGDRFLHLPGDIHQLGAPLGLHTDLLHCCVSYETMPPAPPSDRELDAYREQADRFIAELDEEFYLHYAGHKESFDLSPIYDRHRNLTELDVVRSIGLAVNGGDRVRELWRFACEGHFGELTRDYAERLAALESELQVTIDGEEIPFRLIRPAIANEPDRGKRERLDAIAAELVDEQMNPLYLEAAQAVQAASHEL